MVYKITANINMESRLRQESSQLTDQLAQANRQLAMDEAVLQLLFITGQTVTASPDLSKGLSFIAEAAARLSEAEESMIILLDQHGELYVHTAWRADGQLTADFQIKAKESLIGQTVRTGQPLIVGGQDEYEVFKLADNYFVKSMANIPLRINDRIIGALVVNNKKTVEPFNTGYLRPLSILANFASLIAGTDEIRRSGD